LAARPTPIERRRWFTGWRSLAKQHGEALAHTPERERGANLAARFAVGKTADRRVAGGNRFVLN